VARENALKINHVAKINAINAVEKKMAARKTVT
jgi:hypothetical protein